MKRSYVTQHRLNLRSTPAVQEDNIVAILPYDHMVTAVDGSDTSEWLKVSTQVEDHLLTGYVQAQYLQIFPESYEAIAGCDCALLGETQ